MPGIVGGGIGIVNLEGPIGVAAQPSGGRLRLAQSPRIVQELWAAGIGVACVANNHSEDLGAKGLARTAQKLRAGGIAASGSDVGTAQLDLGGKSFVVAAVDLSDGEPDDLVAMLTNAKAAADVLIVGFHVTDAATYLPTARLERSVELALAAGARVIVSHGTHRLARIERRGDAVIAWGLGNLAFSCDCTEEDEGLVLRVSFAEDDSLAAEIIPIRAGLRGRGVQSCEDVDGIADLLRGLGSSAFRQDHDRFTF